jgi:hypothetical protein
MTDAFLHGLFWSLIVIELLLGSVLLIAGIGWIGRWVVRWLECKVDGMIGEWADNE